MTFGVGHVLRAAQLPRRGEAVIIVGVFTAARLSWLPSFRRGRVLLWEHSITADRMRRVRRMRLLARLARRSYRRSNVVCPTRAVAAAVEGLGARSVTIIPNVIEPSSGTTDERVLRRGQIRLGVVGRVEPVRNPLAALEVLEHLDARFYLEVFGDGSALPTLRSEVARLGLTDRVTFHGWVDDRSEIMAGIDMLLSLSLSETFGYSLLEAADAHVPVIALDVGAVTEMVPTYAPGRVVPGDSSAHDIAMAVERLVAAGTAPAEFATADALRRQDFAASTVADAWCALLGISLPGQAAAAP